MPRNLYGNSLPSVAESRDSDIFYDINTGKSYVFDNGQWNELPQTTPEPPGPEIPTPAAGDAGKVLKVGEDLSYELGEGGGSGYSGVPVLKTTKDNTDDVGTYIEGISENLGFILVQVAFGEVTLLVPIIASSSFILENVDVETQLEISDLYTYNNDGTTSSYSGIHNIWVAEDCYQITGGLIESMSIVKLSTTNYAMIIDLDTGKMVYAPNSN